MGADFSPGQTRDALLHSVLNSGLVDVGAPAGSIMIIDPAAKELHIKARLGPPRAGRKGEPVFPLAAGGIAGWVARNGAARLVSDVTLEPDFHRTRESEHEFKSLLCVPIVWEGKVLGVINADHESASYFAPNHQAKLEELGKQLGESLAKRISVPEAFQLISRKLAHQASAADIGQTLHDIADSIKRAMDADIVILYEYDQMLHKFIHGPKGMPTICGEIRHPEYMGSPIYPTDVPHQILMGGSSVYIPDLIEGKAAPLSIFTMSVRRQGQLNPERSRFAEREGIRSLASVPLIHGAPDGSPEYVGVLFVNYKQTHVFNIDEKEALATFADTAALAILNARRFDRNRRERQGLYHRITDSARCLLDAGDPEGRAFQARFRGREQDLFVMAIDIRRSTDLMLNATAPKGFVHFISQVERRLKDAVRRNFGIVDKFTGDGLIAYFPSFYSGGGHGAAGLWCMHAAAECHAEFKAAYDANGHCFQVVLADVGLGIGIDFGPVHLNMEGQELVAVGRPVVYACRLSSAKAGLTVMNEQAILKVTETYPDALVAVPTSVDVKHEGACTAFEVKLSANQPALRLPAWARSSDGRSDGVAQAAAAIGGQRSREPVTERCADGGAGVSAEGIGERAGLGERAGPREFDRVFGLGANLLGGEGALEEFVAQLRAGGSAGKR